MAESNEKSARCVCGATGIAAKTVSHRIAACHCCMCRKWGGGPFMGVDGGTEVTLDGEENISVFESSKWAERGFCRRCGTHLFYRVKRTGQYALLVGLLGDDEGFVFDEQLFVEEKPSYYRFANETHDLTGAEFFAKYGNA